MRHLRPLPLRRPPRRGAPRPALVAVPVVETVQGMAPAMAVGKALAPVLVPAVGMAPAMAAEMETAPVLEMASPWDRSF